MIAREAGWIAVMLALLVLVMALMGTGRSDGLPTVAEIEESGDGAASALCGVPLVGPVLCGVQRQFVVTAWEL